MSQAEKSDLFKKLKSAGVEFSLHYREYSTEQLQDAANKLFERDPELAVRVGLFEPPPPGEGDQPEQAHYQPPPIPDDIGAGTEDDAEAAAFFGQGRTAEHNPRMPAPVQEAPPISAADPNELPGQRLNTNVDLEPIRTDELGRIWFQEEVRKPSGAQPRGRRVLSYVDRGSKTETVRDGEYVETIEVAGTGPGRSMQVKITLPSYQVGIYKDKRFPFKIHVYNENQGFDREEVENYYGGREFVPPGVKRTYVENVLCYDIRTVVRAIQAEYRQLQLQGKVR